MSSYGLSLSLSIDRDLFVRFESIVVHVSLINNDLKAVTVEDLTAVNDPLFFKAVNNLGGRFKGSLQSFWVRDGVSSIPVRGKSMITLNSKQAKRIHVDLISVFGELPEGEYRVVAYYRLDELSFLRSNTVSFKVVKAKPIYSRTFQDYARNDVVPIRTSWVNEGDDGFYIFIMDCSYNLPSNIISNYRILKVNGLKNVVSSILSIYRQDVEHILWADGNALYVAEILNGSLKNIRRINTSIGSPLLPSLTTDDGELRLLTFLRGNAESIIYLVRIPFEEDVKIDEVSRFKGVINKYSTVFDEDFNPHLAYSLNGKIYYLKVNVHDRLSVEGIANVLAEVKDPIVNLHLSNAWEDEEGNYHIVLNYVVQENNRLCSYLMDVEGKKHLSHLYIPLENMNLKLLQVILDYNYNPYFLFQDNSGALWFKPYDGGFIRVTGKNERCPGNVSYPTMLISSKYSSKYGVYLRYIKNKSVFTYKKLKKLER